MSKAATTHKSNIPAVRVFDDRVQADSRDVAAHFGKSHFHVLEAIRSAHCSEDFRQSNFRSFKTKDLTGETTSHVMMTKDGFAFIGFGFTGAKAGAFKEAWLLAFNAMEAEIRQQRGQLATIATPTLASGLLHMMINRKLVIVDATNYAIGPDDEAVVCGHDGKIEILQGPLEPSTSSSLGKRAIVGPWQASTAGGIRERSYYTVLGRVVTASEKGHPTKPVRVRAHRRALPKPVEGDVPDVFAPGSDVLRDLYSAVMSANARTQHGHAPSFAQAIEDVLAYHIERRGNPLYEPRRPGAVFDHNGKRIEKRQKERADALRERGLLPFPDAQKRSG